MQGILQKNDWLALVDCAVFDSPRDCKKKRRNEKKFCLLEECDLESLRRKGCTRQRADQRARAANQPAFAVERVEPNGFGGGYS